MRTAFASWYCPSLKYPRISPAASSMSSAWRMSVMSATMAPRSMAAMPNRTVPTMVKLCMVMPPCMVELSSVAGEPSATSSLPARPSLIRASPGFWGRRPRTMELSIFSRATSLDPGENRSMPCPPTGACSRVSPCSSGMSSKPPNRIRGTNWISGWRSWSVEISPPTPSRARSVGFCPSFSAKARVVTLTCPVAKAAFVRIISPITPPIQLCKSTVSATPMVTTRTGNRLRERSRNRPLRRKWIMTLSP